MALTVKEKELVNIGASVATGEHLYCCSAYKFNGTRNASRGSRRSESKS